MAGTNDIYFKVLGLDNERLVFPSFFLKYGYSFYRNQMYVHNIHKLYFVMDYVLRIFIPKHYFLLFFEITYV